jgi:hypothetical protein
LNTITKHKLLPNQAELVVFKLEQVNQMYECKWQTLNEILPHLKVAFMCLLTSKSEVLLFSLNTPIL